MEVFGFNIPIWLVIIVIILALSYRYLTNTYDTFTKMGVPGPKPYPPLGTVLQIFKMGFAKHDIEMHSKYGNFVGLFNNRNPQLVIRDPEILKQIMVKDFNHFRNRMMLISDPPFDKMMSMLRDDHWKYVRAHVTPAFSGQKLRRMVELMNNCSKTLINNLMVPARAGDSVDCREHLRSYAMDVIASTGFSLDIDSQNDKNNKFVLMANEFTEFDNKIGLVVFLSILPDFLRRFLAKFGVEAISREALDFFTDIIKKSIADRKEHSEESGRDFLQLMMDAQIDETNDDQNKSTKQSTEKSVPHRKSTKPGLTEEEVKAQALLFFIAGFQNTAQTICFVMFNLALYPDCEERAYQEIVSKLRMDEDPSYDNVKDLTYLNMCLEETLRLYPPAIRMDRKTNEDITIKGIHIPKGMDIGIPIRALHMDPEVWNDPEKFDPERFTPEAKTSRHEFQYMPFGMGPRNCVAKRLAQLEMKIALVHLIRAFKFVKCDKTPKMPLEMKQLQMEPKDGTWLKLESRQPA